MKKAIALLLALAVLGGAAFAQVTFNGYVRTIGTIMENPLNEEYEFKYEDRVRFNMGWTSEDKNVLFRSRFQYTTAGWATEPNYMFGQVKMMDGKLAISGGDLWNWDYDVASGLSEHYIGNVNNGGRFLDDGMLVQFAPMPELSLGLGLAPKGLGTALAPKPIGLDAAAVFAKYTMTDLGFLVLRASFAEEMADSSFFATFKFTGVKDLGIAAGYKMVPDAASAFGIIDYKTGPITIQVAPEYKLDAESFYVEAGVMYKANDKLSLLASVSYEEDVFFALETLYAPTKGALLQANLTYTEAAGIAIPLVVKVSF